MAKELALSGEMMEVLHELVVRRIYELTDGDHEVSEVLHRLAAITDQSSVVHTVAVTLDLDESDDFAAMKLKRQVFDYAAVAVRRLPEFQIGYGLDFDVNVQVELTLQYDTYQKEEGFTLAVTKEGQEFALERPVETWDVADAEDCIRWAVEYIHQYRYIRYPKTVRHWPYGIYERLLLHVPVTFERTPLPFAPGHLREAMDRGYIKVE